MDTPTSLNEFFGNYKLIGPLISERFWKQYVGETELFDSTSKRYVRSTTVAPEFSLQAGNYFADAGEVQFVGLLSRLHSGIKFAPTFGTLRPQTGTVAKMRLCTILDSELAASGITSSGIIFDGKLERTENAVTYSGRFTYKGADVIDENSFCLTAFPNGPFDKSQWFERASRLDMTHVPAAYIENYLPPKNIREQERPK